MEKELVRDALKTSVEDFKFSLEDNANLLSKRISSVLDTVNLAMGESEPIDRKVLSSDLDSINEQWKRHCKTFLSLTDDFIKFIDNTNASFK